MLQTEAGQECFVLLPLAQVRQLLSRSCVRIRRVVLRSELHPACAWLSLAGSRPVKGREGGVGGFRCLKIQIKGGLSLDKKSSKK